MEANVVIVEVDESALPDEQSLGSAAEFISELIRASYRPLVIVSALKGVKDELKKIAERINPAAHAELVADVLAMGERTSVRLFTLALMRAGIESEFIEPQSEKWPIITDENYLDAEPIIDKCKERVVNKLMPLMEGGKVPVICGSLGMSEGGKVTTLGVGGGEVSAAVLANCLNAKEIVVISELVDEPRGARETPKKLLISHIEDRGVAERALMGFSLFQGKAMRYLPKETKLRIGSLDALKKGGAILQVTSIQKLDASILVDDLDMVTIVGQRLDSSKTLGEIFKVIGDCRANMLSLTIDPNMLILYLRGGYLVVERLRDVLIEEDLGKAISYIPDLTMINVTGAMLEVKPDLLQRIIRPLSENGIKIFGMITARSSAKIIVSGKEASKALNLVRRELESLIRWND